MRLFQFTISTLLLAMAWVGLICVAIRSPTEFWTLLVFLITFVMVLTSAFACIYGTGSGRALALGFLMFSVGYVLCITLLPGSLVLPFWWDKQASPLVSWLSSQLRKPSPGTRVENFQAVCHLVLATVLGLLGGVIARFLCLTCRRTAQAK